MPQRPTSPVSIAGRASVAAAILAGAVVLRSGTAFAADADTERARALFEEAGELERHGQWGTAQDRLRAALRLRETPQLHYALAWALENDDKLLEAKAEYETALRQGRAAGPAADEATRLATARLVDLEKKMPIIRIRVAGPARSSTKVMVDGRELRLEDDGATTAVNPGTHVVHVERGTDGVDQMVYVGRSTVRTVDFDSGALAEGPRPAGALRATAPTRHAAARPEPHAAPVLPWVLVSGGILGVVGGAALLISSGTDADERDAMRARWCSATACNGAAPTLPESAEAAGYRRAAEDAGDSSTTKQTVGLILGTTGAITAGIGALLLFRHGDEKPRARSSTGLARTAVAPLPGGAAASAAFVF